jgi:type IV secretion system protein TrbI
MAATDKRLTMHPVPHATRYNRLVQYGLCGAGALIVLTYLIVMSSRGDKPHWERPDRFVTLNRPLLTNVEQPPPPPPPPLPALPPQTFPQATTAPLPHSSTTPHPNPDAERRKAALLKALTAKVLVAEFSADRPQPTATPVVLSSAPHSGSPPFAHLASPWPHHPAPEHMAAWTGGQPPGPPTALVGRSHDFWQQSSHATSEQYLAARVQPPRAPYQVNAGTLVPAVLAQAITSDLEGTVTAQISHDVYDSVTGRFLLIPQGARLFGVYDADLQANQPRLHVAFIAVFKCTRSQIR